MFYRDSAKKKNLSEKSDSIISGNLLQPSHIKQCYMCKNNSVQKGGIMSVSLQNWCQFLVDATPENFTGSHL
jgi:hypothetical protein